MERQIITIESQNLAREVDIAVYGHFGFTILLFSTFKDDCLENEENGLINSIKQYIDKGKIRVYSIPTNHEESWNNHQLSPEDKSKKHFEYNNFLLEEVLPFIYDNSGGAVPIITVGAAHGAFYAANTYFRRPDLFLGTIAMSGVYNIQHYSHDFFDDNCYFNSPIHYLPNLNDNYWLSYLKNRKHVYIISGSGDGEKPEESTYLAHVLMSKNIPHLVDIWGAEWKHDWETWKSMLNHFISTKL